MSSLVQVVVVASLNYDITAESPKIPLSGETVLGTRLRRSLGGKGGNQAVALARLGTPVTVVGCVGVDSAGKEYIAAMKSEGIDLTYVKEIPEEPTGTALIVVGEDASNSIVVIPGANWRTDATVASDSERALAQAAAVVAQLETPLDGIEHAFSIARENGVTTFLNPAPARPLEELLPLLSLTDILVPNEIEFAQLLGLEELSFESMSHDAQTLFDLGIKYVVVTLGSKGAALVTPNEVIGFQPLDVPVVDTTAAGDSFIAGLVHSVTGEGCLDVGSLSQGIETGTAVASYVVGQAGAQTALPTRADLGW